MNTEDEMAAEMQTAAVVPAAAGAGSLSKINLRRKRMCTQTS